MSSVNNKNKFVSCLQVHLSDSVGMKILVQLLWTAACQQLEEMTPKEPVSHRPSPPARPSTRPVSTKVVVKGEAITRSPSKPFDWSLVKQKVIN